MIIFIVGKINKVQRMLASALSEHLAAQHDDDVVHVSDLESADDAKGGVVDLRHVGTRGVIHYIVLIKHKGLIPEFLRHHCDHIITTIDCN